MKLLSSLLLASSLLLLIHCSPSSKTDTADVQEPKVPTALPMNPLALGDLSAFQKPGANWQIVEQVSGDYQKASDISTQPGTGVLVNLMTDEAKANLFTQMEHEDLDLEIEFLMPKGSNSGIYFQGRYEIQLFDSWGKEQPTHADCGGIYQRWDATRPEDKAGYEGHAPATNASKAPGLWQKFRIKFIAPRFDESGAKISNARFDEVWHNGILVHEAVEVLGPTRSAAFENEVSHGPLMIQGDHGPVAFRNISYKSYGNDSLRLENITYKLYSGAADHIPSFDTLDLVKEGKAPFIEVKSVSDLLDHYAIAYAGTLHVPVSGDYFLKTAIDDGGDLYIDDSLVVHNQGDPGGGEVATILHLEAGTHPFRLTFYQEVWAATLTVSYEGPGIRYQELAAPPAEAPPPPPPPITVQAPELAEMVRGFVMHKGEKRTHVISVGDPKAVHYSYDLNEASLLSCWRGGFADVTKMWYRRGHDQLLLPLNTAIELTSGIPIAQLATASTEWPTEVPESFASKGYQIGAGGRPVFLFQYGALTIKDQLRPSESGKQLERTLTISGTESQSNTWVRLASGDVIEQLENGLYRIDGNYYLDFPTGDLKIRTSGNQQELLVPVLTNSSQTLLTYSLLW